MFLQVITVLCAVHLLTNECKSHQFIDLPSDSEEPMAMTTDKSESTEDSDEDMTPNETVTTVEPESSTVVVPDVPQKFTNTVETLSGRRFVPIMRQGMEIFGEKFEGEDDDYLLKKKIAVIIQQTVHDTTKRVASVQKVKERVKDQAPYKAGYILSLVRKSRLMLNDLFNLAVKHRDNWRALQQLKVFEYIVHTNVDTTNLVRQLVEVHIQHLNNTVSSKKRVVLL